MKLWQRIIILMFGFLFLLISLSFIIIGKELYGTGAYLLAAAGGLVMVALDIISDVFIIKNGTK